jgi:hypothetical protein
MEPIRGSNQGLFTHWFGSVDVANPAFKLVIIVSVTLILVWIATVWALLRRRLTIVGRRRGFEVVVKEPAVFNNRDEAARK